MQIKKILLMIPLVLAGCSNFERPFQDSSFGNLKFSEKNTCFSKMVSLSSNDDIYVSLRFEKRFSEEGKAYYMIHVRGIGGYQRFVPGDVLAFFKDGDEIYKFFLDDHEFKDEKDEDGRIKYAIVTFKELEKIVHVKDLRIVVTGASQSEDMYYTASITPKQQKLLSEFLTSCPMN